MAGLPTSATILTNQPSDTQQFSTTFLTPIAEYMRINNYSTETIERYIRTLVTLQAKGADLLNPEQVKTTIANQTSWNDGTKAGAVNAIKLFLKIHNIQTKTTFPQYKREPKIAFIPTEQELDQLIVGCKHRLSTFLQTLKETAMRYGEAILLTWDDYDTVNLTLNINHPEKHSNPRTVHISTKLAEMLSTLPQNTKTIFDYASKDVARKNFQRARRRIAKNLSNPRLLKVHFHTFRHWKAVQTLHDTNNVFVVMKLLGHKCLNNTQIYLQLLPDITDNFVCEIAHNTEDVKKLVENGFDYVQTINGNEHVYKKRK